MQPQTFHPELDAIFDMAQDKGVSLAFDNRSFVLLSKASFEIVLRAANISAEAIKHIAVPRVGKPITYILSRETFDELARLHDLLVGLIEDEARARAAC